jgi:hypothetical protein
MLMEEEVHGVNQLLIQSKINMDKMAHSFAHPQMPHK